MLPLELSFCFWDYDRTLPIADGRVPIEGVQPLVTILSPEEAFARAFSTAEFDVTELSLSNYMTAVSEGRSSYIAIPVFPSRTFRHGSIFVRTDRGIDRPEDLKGATLGLQEYQMTAALVVRGLLQDEYSVLPTDIAWRVGDVEQPSGRMPVIPNCPGVDIQTVPADRTLDGMLTVGEIDGLIALHPPPSFLLQNGQVRRLFADWREAEQIYYRKTGIFPVMHTIGIKKSLVDQHPQLAEAIYAAFVESKARAIAELAVAQAPKITLPWVTAELAFTRVLMGDDYWPYGISANRHTLETLVRYSFEQRLINRELRLEELFAPSLMTT